MDDLPAHLRFGGPDGQPADHLLLGDNLAALAELRDGAVDLVYIDPPFGTGATRRGRGGASGYADGGADPEAHTAWLAPRLAQCRCVLAAHGSLFVHLDYRAVHYVKVALNRLFGGDRFVNEIVWCYAIGGRAGAPSPASTTPSCGTRAAPATPFPDAVRIPRRAGSHMRVVRGPDGAPVQVKRDRRTGREYFYPVAAGKVPEDWWADIETLNRADAQRTGWPTQKPEALLARIVAAASAPGALVADWFAGSGTTAVVAQRLGRRFIACDVEPAAVRLAAHRLAAAGAALAAAGAPPPDVVVDRVAALQRRA